jgi:hypothetical protein
VTLNGFAAPGDGKLRASGRSEKNSPAARSLGLRVVYNHQEGGVLQHNAWIVSLVITYTFSKKSPVQFAVSPRLRPENLGVCADQNRLVRNHFLDEETLIFDPGISKIFVPSGDSE